MIDVNAAPDHYAEYFERFYPGFYPSQVDLHWFKEREKEYYTQTYISMFVNQYGFIPNICAINQIDF